MYKINVTNPALTLDIEPSQIQWDIQPLGGGHFHIIMPDLKGYTASLVEANYKEKTFIIAINGNHYNIQAQDQFDLLAEKMGLGSSNAKKANQLKAPMPGLVLNVIVAAGAAVKKGEPLLILEAMKMENVIKAVADGVVRSIHVSKGAAVEKNQLLIDFE
jgi:biotin carboxyl carrier protein